MENVTIFKRVSNPCFKMISCPIGRIWINYFSKNILQKKKGWVGFLFMLQVASLYEGFFLPICVTLMFLVASKPSSWLSSSNIVLCTSLSPPEPPSRREEPMESISSMKMMEGACSLAMTNSSRTIRAPKTTQGDILGLKETFWKHGCRIDKRWELTFSNKFLDQLRARDPDEGAVSVVGYSSG